MHWCKKYKWTGHIFRKKTDGGEKGKETKTAQGQKL